MCIPFASMNKLSKVRSDLLTMNNQSEQQLEKYKLPAQTVGWQSKSSRWWQGRGELQSAQMQTWSRLEHTVELEHHRSETLAHLGDSLPVPSPPALTVPTVAPDWMTAPQAHRPATTNTYVFLNILGGLKKVRCPLF